MTLSLNGIRAWFLMVNLLRLSSLNGSTNPDNFPGNPGTGNHTSFPGNPDIGDVTTKILADVTTISTAATSTRNLTLSTSTSFHTTLLVTRRKTKLVDKVTQNPVNTEGAKTQNETGNSSEYKSKDCPENEKLMDSQLSAGVGLSNTIMCIACIALNGHVLLLYKSQLNKVVPTLYFINGVADILIGSGVALQSFIFIPQIASNKEIAGYLSAISYVIVGVSIRVSTFVNLVLCITRAINILYPFYHVPRVIPVRLTCLYSLIWLILAIWDIVWFHLGVGLTSGLYVIKTLLLKPEVGFAAISTMFKGSVNNVQNLLLLFVPPFLAPLAVLIVSTTVQVAYSG